MATHPTRLATFFRPSFQPSALAALPAADCYCRLFLLPSVLEEHGLRQRGAGGNRVRWAVDPVRESYRVGLGILHIEEDIDPIRQRIRIGGSHHVRIAECD